jgi:hypothetical protein
MLEIAACGRIDDGAEEHRDTSERLATLPPRRESSSIDAQAKSAPRAIPTSGATATGMCRQRTT